MVVSWWEPGLAVGVAWRPAVRARCEAPARGRFALSGGGCLVWLRDGVGAVDDDRRRRTAGEPRFSRDVIVSKLTLPGAYSILPSTARSPSTSTSPGPIASSFASSSARSAVSGRR
jgi:hypothetical protein